MRKVEEIRQRHRSRVMKRSTRNDAEEKWITINGTHIKVEGGELQGSVGKKIASEEKASSSKQKSSSEKGSHGSPEQGKTSQPTKLPKGCVREKGASKDFQSKFAKKSTIHDKEGSDDISKAIWGDDYHKAESYLEGFEAGCVLKGYNERTECDVWAECVGGKLFDLYSKGDDGKITSLGKSIEPSEVIDMFGEGEMRSSGADIYMPETWFGTEEGKTSSPVNGKASPSESAESSGGNSAKSIVPIPEKPKRVNYNACEKAWSKAIKDMGGEFFDGADDNFELEFNKGTSKQTVASNMVNSLRKAGYQASFYSNSKGVTEKPSRSLIVEDPKDRHRYIMVHFGNGDSSAPGKSYINMSIEDVY